MYAGKIRSTVFDKSKDEIIIRKRNITCHRRTVTKYKLSDLQDVRAVWRGIDQGQVNNEHFAVILDFNQENTESTDGGYESSDREVDKFHMAVDDNIQKVIEV